MKGDKRGYDLHLHTYWSYDACAPVEGYFRLAEEKAARAIAITEHFTMDSVPEVLEAAKKHPSVRFGTFFAELFYITKNPSLVSGKTMRIAPFL